MKKIFTLLLVVFASVAQAQVSTPYGFWFDGSGWQFASVDPVTGVKTDVAPLPGLGSITLHVHTMNWPSFSYIFQGMDTGNVRRLYDVDVTTGMVMNNPPLAEDIHELHINCAQGYLLNGLRFDAVNSEYHFVSVDKITGLITDINTLPGLVSIATGNSAFGPFGHYYFQGTDTSSSNLIYEIDPVTGTIVNTVSVMPNTFEWATDDPSGQIYVMKASAGWHLATLDPTTGTTTNLVTVPGINGIVSSTGTLDADNDKYIIRVIDNSANYMLVTIDFANNTVLYNPSMPDHVNNLSLYECIIPVSIAETRKDAPSIYPNPATDHITLDLEHECTVAIYNATGQKVKEVFYAGGIATISVSELSEGIYFIVAGDGERMMKACFIKE